MRTLQKINETPAHNAVKIKINILVSVKPTYIDSANSPANKIAIAKLNNIENKTARFCFIGTTTFVQIKFALFRPTYKPKMAVAQL